MTNEQHDDAACLTLFADTMERLNDISTSQMMSILDIAVAAADAANSIEPTNTDSEIFVEKVKGLLDDMKTEVATGVAGGNRTHDQSATGGTFCDGVLADMNMALQNAVANQQQLNTVGTAVLTEGANLVLQAGKTASQTTS